MRILYHHRVRSRDGQAVHVDELIHALRAQGHEVVVVAPPGFEGSPIGGGSDLAASIKRRLPKFGFELLELLYNLPAYIRLRRAMRRGKPDLIYERYGLFLIAGTILARQISVPLFLEVNSPLAAERKEFGGLAFGGLARALERWVWRRAKRVLPVTGVLASIVEVAGVPADRVTVIPNGIDPGRFQRTPGIDASKAEIGLSGKVVLGFAGFVRNWHGLDAVIAFLADPATPPGLHLLIVGNGPARSELERQARELQIGDRVTFTGVIGRDDVARYIDTFDIALQPRAVDYASPLKLFEYMALSKSIVAPDQPNIREILTHERNALLFAPRNSAAMAAAIVRLAGDAQMRSRLGSAAHRTILERELTWTANAQRIASLAAADIERPASERMMV